MDSPLTPIANLFNKWSVFHAGVGLVLAKVFVLLGFMYPLLWVLFVSVIWEIFEYIVENWRPYGSTQKWAIDTVLDTVLALVFGAIGIYM